MVDEAQRDAAREVDEAREKEEKWAKAAIDAEEAAEELEQELAVVRGREEALKGVIERMIERYGSWLAHEARASVASETARQ